MRILVVEDDKDLNRQITEALADAGYVVDRAHDGEEGHFLGDTEPYDAVVLDIGLPQMDGITATRELIARVPDARVLILTTFDEDEYVVGALRAGIGYKLSPVNDRNRTIFISDNDRLWLGVGGSYQITEKLKLDLAYSYLHVEKASVNYGGAHPQQGPVFYTAEAKPFIHIVSAGLTYRWDNPAETIPVQPVIRKY